jgi:hypothetical protein
MNRDVTVLTLRQFEAAGGLSGGYSFEDFSCPPNREVQDFLRKKAIQSSRLGASTTYLVYGSENSLLLGYFTLVLKPFSIDKTKLSKTRCRLLGRFAEEDRGRYTAAVYLIAQIGKNFAVGEGERIAGSQLLELAFQRLYAARELVGGKIVLVERDTRSPGLIDFYARWNFQSWNERHDAKDGVTYDQMLCSLGNG